jgi:hypothetical protein
MRRFLKSVLSVAGVVAALGVAAPTYASHNEDLHSPNMRLIANLPKDDTTNSDLAFWGNRLFAGNYEGFRIIDITRPSAPRVLSDFKCHGAQSDMGVWGSPSVRQLLFQSIDRDQTKATCDSVDTPANTSGFEGIRILDVTNARHPRFIKGVPTDCGSHTHTVVPDLANNRVLIYVSSYPLTGQDPLVGPPDETRSCNVHFKVSVIEVPLAAPENADVIRETIPFTAPSIGCHDIGAMLPLDRAAAACLTEGEVWEIADRDDPQLLAKLFNPSIQIWHSGAYSNDGTKLIYGDEAGGGAGPFCVTSADTFGRIWFYDAAAPMGPPLGSFKILRPQGGEICTAHNYNQIPFAGHDLLVSAWYGGGTSVINFDNPAVPREVGFYDAQGARPADTWSSYFYNGFIYASDINRGVDIFAFNSPAARQAQRLDHLNPQTQEVLIP